MRNYQNTFMWHTFIGTKLYSRVLLIYIDDGTNYYEYDIMYELLPHDLQKAWLENDVQKIVANIDRLKPIEEDQHRERIKRRIAECQKFRKYKY